MTSQYIYLVIFCCIGYLIITDASVARLFTLLTQLIKFQFEKFKWWILHNPANPIVKYLMWKRSMKLAKELMDELESNTK